MSIERIKEEAAKADQMILELAKGQPADETPEVESEAAQPEVDEQQTDQGVVADAATEDHDDAVSLLREEAAKWEQRYRSLDGMIQARDRQIEQLHQLIAAMQQAPQKEVAPAPEQKGKKLVLKEDEDAFGADLVDLGRRVAREEMDGYVSRLEQKIAELEQRLSGVAQTTALSAQERFEQKLTAQFSDWKSVDEDPAFIAWLKSNAMRLRLFSEAARAHDVEGTAYFYQEYAQGRQAKPASANAQLEKQLAPGKAKAVAPQAKSQMDKKVWTRSEISRTYAGKKSYSPEEFARLERDIAAAQREGRVDFSR